MASFVNMWGTSHTVDEDDECISTKTGTFDTLSGSTDSQSGTQQMIYPLECTSTISSDDQIISDEETPLSPQTPALDATFQRRDNQHDHKIYDEDQMPLSPESEFTTTYSIYQTTSNESRRLYTHHNEQIPADDFDDDDECKPLSPQTPSIPTSGRLTRRFKTPDFLSPGRFTRWRQHNDEFDMTNNYNYELPETPLMTSPTANQHEGVNCFGDIISPLRRSSPGGEGDSAKID